MAHDARTTPCLGVRGSYCPMNADDLFSALETRSLSPKLRWMRDEGIITWYDNGKRDGYAACPAQWFAGFQKWWPGQDGICFFAAETAENGDSRIGEGETEGDALADLMTCGEARERKLRLWFEQDAP